MTVKTMLITVGVTLLSLAIIGEYLCALNSEAASFDIPILLANGRIQENLDVGRGEDDILSTYGKPKLEIQGYQKPTIGWSSNQSSSDLPTRTLVFSVNKRIIWIWLQHSHGKWKCTESLLIMEGVFVN
jgi:hypothetical protein